MQTNNQFICINWIFLKKLLFVCARCKRYFAPFCTIFHHIAPGCTCCTSYTRLHNDKFLIWKRKMTVKYIVLIVNLQKKVESAVWRWGWLNFYHWLCATWCELVQHGATFKLHGANVTRSAFLNSSFATSFLIESITTSYLTATPFTWLMSHKYLWHKT